MQQEILTFWFGDLKNPNQWDSDKSKNWFMGGVDFDLLIQSTFEDDIFKAVSGEYEHWKETPKGCLALIILLDQFPRNVFRGTLEAFKTDLLALEVTLSGIEKGFDRELYPIERQFFYMPLMHSEDVEMQQRSLEMFHQLYEEAPEEKKEHFSSVEDYAKDHYEIVAEFDRFPHRNEILCREPTEEEILFLTESSSSYGQTRK